MWLVSATQQSHPFFSTYLSPCTSPNVCRVCERVVATDSDPTMSDTGGIASSTGRALVAGTSRPSSSSPPPPPPPPPPPSTIPQEDALALPRRTTTRVSVASELLRTCVRHARHLAESLVDDGRPPVSVFSRGSDATGMATAENAGAGHRQQRGWEARSRAAGGGVVVEISNGERWGGSTDGIVDTSPGGGGSGGGDGVQPHSNLSRASVDAIELGKDDAATNAAPITAGAMVTESSVAAAEAAEIRAGAPWASSVSTSTPPAAAARVVGETLRLAREAPIFLARAVAALADNGGVLSGRGGRDEGGCIREQSRLVHVK